jgi:hypothetical protein
MQLPAWGDPASGAGQADAKSTQQLPRATQPGSHAQPVEGAASLHRPEQLSGGGGAASGTTQAAA